MGGGVRIEGRSEVEEQKWRSRGGGGRQDGRMRCRQPSRRSRLPPLAPLALAPPAHAGGAPSLAREEGRGATPTSSGAEAEEAEGEEMVAVVGEAEASTLRPPRLPARRRATVRPKGWRRRRVREGALGKTHEGEVHERDKEARRQQGRGAAGGR